MTLRKALLVAAVISFLAACSTSNDDPFVADSVDPSDVGNPGDSGTLDVGPDTGTPPDLVDPPADLVPDRTVDYPCEADEDCPDQLPPGDDCHVSRCIDGGCEIQRAQDGTSCDDGEYCSGGDVCREGLCVAGSLNPCDDGNPCTEDHCEGEEQCSYTPASRSCDDGDPCTANDYCVDGDCVGDPAPSECPCDDDADCVEYDDGDLCNGAYACRNGGCTPVGAVVCDEPEDPCQAIACDPESGDCVIGDAEEGTACDDGDACTQNDVCRSGVCQGDADGCPCGVHADCDPYDDGDRCNGVYRCVSGQCRYDASTVVECPVLPDACRASVCVPATGLCSPQDIEDGSACNDGNACTVGESCQGGFCSGGEAADCDDDDPCTFDRCDFYFGCVHDIHDGPCDDGDACTVADRCWAGVCVGYPSDCGDDNPCTEDRCEPGIGCIHVATTGPCTDGNPCTDGDACFEGLCVSGPVDACGNCVSDVECRRYDDEDLCDGVLACIEGLCRPDPDTVIDCDGASPTCQKLVCEPRTGTCVQAPVEDGIPCNYENPCRKDGFCASGTCVSTLVDCDDGNECTEDVCSTTDGCVHTPVSVNCDDGNLCTNGDFCLEGVCMPGTYTCMTCDSDSDCDPAENDNRCDGVPKCVAGQCLQDEDSLVTCPVEAPDSCRVPVCDEDTGACSTTALPPGASCDDDNLCTANDRCEAGTGLCVGNDIDCDDDNPCTDDACDPHAGCVHTPNDDVCDDRNACTQTDSCVLGVCVGTDPVVCFDDDPCTDDLCDRIDGTCSFEMNTAPCDDGNACTMFDQCVVGECWGQDVPCVDGNPCTTDSCDPDLGCVYVFNEDECDDGQPCSLGDHCEMGICFAGVWACNEYCGNGLDDDNDLLTDCLDPDCADYPLCVGEGSCEPVGTIACDENVFGDLSSDDTTDRIISYAGCREGDYAGPELAWTFVAPNDGIADVRLLIPEAPYQEGLRVDVFVVPEDELGYCIANTGCIAWGLMGQYGTQGRSQAFFHMQAGVTYYIIADGQHEAETELDIQMVCY